MPARHHLERHAVDGVPAYTTDTPGPAFGLLQFRVGRADEPLTHAGVTHLVEHLAFHRLHHLPYEHNGVTEPTMTRFYAEGEPDEVLTFLRTVVAALAEPPLERVGREAAILAEEAADRNTEALDVLLRSRHGARPYGRPAFPEFGLSWLDAAAVHAWRTARFTRANASLAFGNVRPSTLGLDALPAGDRVALPPCDPLDEPTPAHVHGPDGIVLGTLLVPRGPVTGLAAAVLERALEQRLRHDHGLAYETILDLHPLDAATSELVLGAVVRDDDRAQRVAEELASLLDELATRGPAAELFEAARTRFRRTWTDPTAAAGSAVMAAEGELIGRDMSDLDAELAEIDAADAAAIAVIVGPAAGSLRLTAPEGVDLDEAVFGDCALPFGGGPVTGSTHGEARFGRHRNQLVVGEDALGLRFADGDWLRLPYEDVAVAVHYDDGSRELVSDDGFLVPLEPDQWRKGAAAIAAIDARIAAERCVPARADGTVPEQRLPRPA
jgi:zinc protease